MVAAVPLSSPMKIDALCAASLTMRVSSAVPYTPSAPFCLICSNEKSPLSFWPKIVSSMPVPAART